jgi:hypothetical protein
MENLPRSTINAFMKGKGSLAILWHVLEAIVAHGEVLSARNVAAERRLQVVQPVTLLECSLALAAARVGDPGLGAHSERWWWWWWSW